MPWLFLIMFLVAWSWWEEGGFQSAMRLQAQRRALERENQVLEQSNQRLRREIQIVETDPPFLEWMARERLGMIGERERLYIFQE